MPGPISSGISSGRQWVINGETLITAKGGEHLSGGPLGYLTELGLAMDQVTIRPYYFKQDVKLDDFGPEAAADVIANLIDCRIRATLINYDRQALDVCIAESFGGGLLSDEDSLGTPRYAGIMLGGYKDYHASGWHFTSLNLLSPQLRKPYHFPSVYLMGPPLEIPLGTKTTALQCEWRAIQYRPPVTTASGKAPFEELTSRGLPLWTRTAQSG